MSNNTSKKAHFYTLSEIFTGFEIHFYEKMTTYQVKTFISVCVKRIKTLKND